MSRYYDMWADHFVTMTFSGEETIKIYEYECFNKILLIFTFYWIF